MAISEFQLIEQYFKTPFADGAAGVVLGIGDDAAVLSVADHEQVVVSTDTVNEGVHFPLSATAEQIASRAFCTSLSDLAAMGATPRWFTIALSLPQVDEAWLLGFSQQLQRLSQQYGCHLVGGDTTRGSLSISVTVMGVVERGKALTRCGAKAGDAIYITGQLGMGAAGLAATQNQLRGAAVFQQKALQHYWQPKVQIQHGLAIAPFASACIDISDGLLADMAHICRASCVGALIERYKLPVATELKQNSTWLQWVLAGGDEYQLCFCVPKAVQADMLNALQQAKLNVTYIGEIVEGDEINFIDGAGDILPVSHHVESRGYRHF